MMEREPAVHALVAEIGRYLADFDAAEIAELRSRLADLSRKPVEAIAPQPDPACGYLDEALSAATGAAALADTILAARPHLRWITYDGYDAEEIGPHFPKAHAFATIVGPAGLVPARDFELGLFLIAPRTLYRDHHHAAPELYAPLTGSHRWRFGIEAPWQNLPAHRPVWNAPWAVHATAVGAVPLLCIYCWTRDVELPARVVRSDDWPEIERRLERGWL